MRACGVLRCFLLHDEAAQAVFEGEQSCTASENSVLLSTNLSNTTQTSHCPPTQAPANRPRRTKAD